MTSAQSQPGVWALTVASARDAIRLYFEPLQSMKAWFAGKITTGAELALMKARVRAGTLMAVVLLLALGDLSIHAEVVKNEFRLMLVAHFFLGTIAVIDIIVHSIWRRFEERECRRNELQEEWSRLCIQHGLDPAIARSIAAQFTPEMVKLLQRQQERGPSPSPSAPQLRVGTEGSNITMTDDEAQLFVERRPEGDYAVRKPNAEMASDVLPTQAEAIERARELNSDRPPLVERVRQTKRGKPDKRRKP